MIGKTKRDGEAMTGPGDKPAVLSQSHSHNNLKGLWRMGESQHFLNSPECILGVGLRH